MNAMFPRIILLFLDDSLRSFPGRVRSFLIDSDPFAIENGLLMGFLNEFTCIRVFLWSGLLVIEGRGEIDLYVGVDDANCFVIVLRLYL